MTEDLPYGERDRDTMWKVLARWLQEKPNGSDGMAPALAYVREEFQPALDKETIRFKVKTKELPLRLNEWGWLIGAPLTDSRATPVLTLELKSSDGQNIDDAIFRVSLLQRRDGEDTIATDGWRFEMAEPGDKSPHPFSHVQASTGWSASGIQCLLHPPHELTDSCDGTGTTGPLLDERLRARALVLTKHPAFPLPVKTLTGLALAVVVSLYGRNEAKRIFSDEPSLLKAPRIVHEDMQWMGLDPYAQQAL